MNSSALYSDKQILAREKATLNELIQMDATTIEQMNQVAEYLQENHDNCKDFSERMTDEDDGCYLTPNSVFRFYLNTEWRGQPMFAKTLEDPSLPHCKVWAKILKDAKHIDFDVPAVDGSEPFTLAKNRIANYIIGRLKNPESTDTIQQRGMLMNLGCHLGSHELLIKRLEESLSKIKNGKEDLMAIGYFYNDLLHIGNTYGTFGYFHAATLLWDLGNHFDNLGDEHNVQAVAAYKKATECILRAKALYEDAHNHLDRKVLNVLTDGKGLQFFIGEKDSAFHIPDKTIKEIETEYDSTEARGKIDALIYYTLNEMFVKRLTDQVIAGIQSKVRSSKCIDFSLSSS